MSPREKRLLALVIVAFLFAVGDFLYSALNEFRNESLVVSHVKDAQRAIGDVNTALVASTGTNNMLDRLSYANMPLASDPLVRAAPAAGQDWTGEQLPFLNASGFIALGQTTIAIINGGEYSVGDVIPETGELVQAVDAEGVTLLLEESGATRRLVYMEESAENEVRLVP